MATTIQVSEKLAKELKNRKMFDNESYEEIIWDLLEDEMELSAETKRDIEIARAEIKAGKTHTLSEVEKALGL